MNDRSGFRSALLIAALLALPALAQTTPPAPTLESLKATYEKAKKEIDSCYDQQKAAALAAYGKAVEESMGVYQRKGDLDAYLLLEKAKKDAEGGAAIPSAEGAHAGLVSAIGVYQKLLTVAETEKSKRISVLLGRYTASLQEQVKRLMKLEKIDEAKVVNEELERAKTERGAMPEGEKGATPATPAPTTPAPTTPTPAATATTPKEGDYPSIAGSWKEDKGGVFVVSQNGRYWTGKCSYMHPRFGEVRCEIKGSVGKDLQIKGDMRYFKAPSSTMKPHTRTGTLSADGQTINFTVSKSDTDEEIVWTKQAK